MELTYFQALIVGEAPYPRTRLFNLGLLDFFEGFPEFTRLHIPHLPEELFTKKCLMHLEGAASVGAINIGS